MQLNTLYGYFGRSRDLITTKFVNHKELQDILKVCVVKTVIEIEDDSYIVLISNNVNHQMLDELNNTID
jgi:hypothetical protein